MPATWFVTISYISGFVTISCMLEDTFFCMAYSFVIVNCRERAYALLCIEYEHPLLWGYAICRRFGSWLFYIIPVSFRPLMAVLYHTRVL